MIFTREGGEIGVYEGTTAPLVSRAQNTAIAKLNQDEALALIAELSSKFGAEGVPATSVYEKIYIVLEDPTYFYPQDMS